MPRVASRSAYTRKVALLDGMLEARQLPDLATAAARSAWPRVPAPLLRVLVEHLAGEQRPHGVVRPAAAAPRNAPAPCGRATMTSARVAKGLPSTQGRAWLAPVRRDTPLPAGRDRRSRVHQSARSVGVAALSRAGSVASARATARCVRRVRWPNLAQTSGSEEGTRRPGGSAPTAGGAAASPSPWRVRRSGSADIQRPLWVMATYRRLRPLTAAGPRWGPGAPGALQLGLRRVGARLSRP